MTRLTGAQQFWVVLVGVGAIVILEAIALLRGVDGTVAAGAFAALGAIVGFAFGYRKGSHQ